MGLDMYLSAKKFIGADDEHRNVKGEINLTEGIKNTPINIPVNRVESISCNVAYWRKFNALHNWFVNNIQDGKDDCGEYYIGRDTIQTIITLCETVKEVIDKLPFKQSSEHEAYFTKEKFTYKIYENTEKLEKLFPTTGGFFFGDTEYDEYYLKKVERTIVDLKKALEDFDDSWEFYYSSSW